jgi:PAS domain S-box-containing protein
MSTGSPTLQTLYERQKLIADISQILHSSLSPKKDFDKVLRMIGEHINVSRVYIFENNQEGTSSSNTFEWCNKGIEPMISRMQNVPFSAVPGVKKELTGSKNHFFSGNFSTLNPKTRKFLESQNIKSILVYPLYVEKQFHGFIGFDECVRERDWNNGMKDLLRSIASIISNFIEKSIVMERFRLNEALLNFAITNSNSGLWDWNPETNHAYHNQSYYQILGYNPEEYENSFDFWQKTIHPEDSDIARELLYNHVQGLSPSYEAIYRIVRKDNSWRWILDKGMVVARDKHGKATRVTGLIRDITNQKLQELRFRELNKTKDKLLSIISHDLKGPIGNMIPIIDMLISEQDLDEEQKNQFMEYLLTASKNTYELLENLLLWSRSQADSIKLKPELLSLQQLVNRNIKLISTAARNKNLSISIQSAVPVSIFADKDSVNLILRNLLSNAIKFTPKGGKIIVNTRQQEKFALIEVIDNGTGMNRETLDNLFSPNTFTSHNGTERETGTGLGLILCKDFAERNNGNITADNRPEGGSIFTVKLPLA